MASCSAMRRFPLLLLVAGAQAFSLTGPLMRPAASSPLLRSSRGAVPRVGAATSANFCAKLVTSDERTASLPWKESVAGAEHRLLYMPFLDWQLKFLRDNVELTDLPFEEHLSKQQSTKKPAVIESWQYETPEFRKIRLTYIDAGQNAQVFNSVWYPRHSYDAPILGIDFLAFGPKKVLAIMDLQPLSQDEAYLDKYIKPLIPLRDKYQDLCGRMSSRFYDEAQFFSKELLFGRFDNDGPVMESLYPAMQEYVEYYLKTIRGLTPDNSEQFQTKVKEMQREYDQYSAEKDPAVGLFTTYWGKDWAEDFTYNFLFSDADISLVEPKEEKKDSKKGASVPRGPLVTGAAYTDTAYYRNKAPWDL